MIDFDRYPNFDSREFASPDQPGSGAFMNQEFMDRLQHVRSRCGFPFEINSGFRIEHRNKVVGGAANSAHLRGRAADIACTNSGYRFEIVEGALALGFRRIGIAKSFIHLDDDPTLPKRVMWLY